MTRVTREKICDIAPKDAFNIVKNFKAYPEFLPWCSGARLRSHRDLENGKEAFTADLVISYKAFCETFTTDVTCHLDHKLIDVSYVKGPFKRLESYWKFHAVDGNKTQTRIEFMIDFEFKSMIFQKIVGLFFEEAMRRMIDAFEKRFIALD